MMDAVSCFEKKYYFKTYKQGWSLPSPQTMFKERKWELPELMSYKKNLNEVKGKLNDYPLKMWHQHTSSMNPAGSVIGRVRREVNPEFLTQAWCKFFETACSFDLIPQHAIEAAELQTVHLCEAPGAFVASLNHFLTSRLPHIQWNWMAITLNPHHEGNDPNKTILDDRLLIPTHQHWTYGADHTGDIMIEANMHHVLNEAKRRGHSGRGTLLLVTADGSIDCQWNPEEQESVVSALHMCEAVTAMLLLDKGGSLLLKAFTIFEAENVCLLYLLACSFESLVAWKPATSREGNSEMYLVCLNYLGKTSLRPWLEVLSAKYGHEFNYAPMFSINSLPKGFLDQVIDCAYTFMTYQVTVIERNISTYGKNKQLNKKRNFSYFRYVPRLRYAVTEEFFCRYKPVRICREARLISSSDPSQTHSVKWLHCLYDYKGELTFTQKLRHKKKEISHVEVWESLNGTMESSDTILKEYCPCALNINQLWTGVSAMLCELPPLNLNLDLKDVTVGLPVKKVLCSKFCHIWFLHLHEQIQLLCSHLSGPCMNETTSATGERDVARVGVFVEGICDSGKRGTVALNGETLEVKSGTCVRHNILGPDISCGILRSKGNHKTKTEDTSDTANLMVKSDAEDYKSSRIPPIGGMAEGDDCMLRQVTQFTCGLTTKDCYTCFSWSDKMCGRNFGKKLEDLMRVFNTVEEDGDLLIQDVFPLLTKFQVGIIYLLGLLFQRFWFTWPSVEDDEMEGYSILLNGRRSSSDDQFNVQNYLNEITILAQNEEKKNVSQTILDVVPVSLLCVGDFFNCILYMNHLFLKDIGEKSLKKCSEKLGVE